MPRGNDRVEPGDRLIVFTTHAAADRVRDYFTSRARPDPGRCVCAVVVHITGTLVRHVRPRRSWSRRWSPRGTASGTTPRVPRRRAGRASRSGWSCDAPAARRRRPTPRSGCGASKDSAIVAATWLVIAHLAAIPYVWAGLGFIDALFESMSGLTTTGATMLTDFSGLRPRHLLLARDDAMARRHGRHRAVRRGAAATGDRRARTVLCRGAGTDR